MKVLVIHEWENDQKDTVNKFFNQIVSMAKEKKLPKGMKLEKVSVSQDANTAVCEWDVENMDMLMQAAKQFNVTWKVKPIAEEVLYQHKSII